MSSLREKSDLVRLEWDASLRFEAQRERIHFALTAVLGCPRSAPLRVVFVRQHRYPLTPAQQSGSDGVFQAALAAVQGWCGHRPQVATRHDRALANRLVIEVVTLEASHAA